PAAEQLTTEGSVFSPEQARAIIEQFRATNEKLGKLRYLIVVTHEQMSSSPPTVADRNRTRDVEQWTRELFASAGANLIDPSVGVPLLGSKPYHRLPAADNAKAKKDRAALSGAADAVVEVTIVVRYVKVPTSAGETTYVVPGVMIEAYRISDSALLGATSTLDVLKSRGLPDDAIMKITMHDRAETAALALMEDMKRNVP
ncbi:MAG TPA: hypothetical protein VFK10_13845, partial [Burkholderiaceae bacterium]|nr:hypothetical protein [Burkholderiaceae bacterium]